MDKKASEGVCSCPVSGPPILPTPPCPHSGPGHRLSQGVCSSLELVCGTARQQLIASCCWLPLFKPMDTRDGATTFWVTSIAGRCAA